MDGLNTCAVGSWVDRITIELDSRTRVESVYRWTEHAVQDSNAKVRPRTEGVPRTLPHPGP